MIVVGGEALVDLVPEDAGDRARLSPRLGGAPFNAAIAAARLRAGDGPAVALAARLSRDSYGRALHAALLDAGVDEGLLQHGDEPTPLALVHLDERGAARYTFYMQGTADREFQAGSLPPEAGLLSLGTASMMLEPSVSRYERLLAQASERGLVTVLDPNIRAELIADPDAYRERFHGWLPQVSVLKLSVDDAEWLAGEQDLLAAARRWQRAGPEAVVLTMGGAGLTAVTAKHEVTVTAPPVTVLDTIGAGDTVHGALLNWLAERGCLGAGRRERVATFGEREWRSALTAAATAAAITCSRHGAQPPSRQELLSALSAARV